MIDLNIPIEKILVNVGYILMLLALVVRDMLVLRSLLMSGQLFITIYSLSIDNNAVAFYNTLFFIINSIQVIRLFRERRPIELSEELAELHKKIFSTMSKREFLTFWNMGYINEDSDSFIIKKGEHMDRLYLILSGFVDVLKNGRRITRLAKGSFIAEMSFLTGEPASADIQANGSVKHISWNQDKLRHMDQLHPDLLIKIQNILGKDLVNKIKIASEEKNKASLVT